MSERDTLRIGPPRNAARDWRVRVACWGFSWMLVGGSGGLARAQAKEEMADVAGECGLAAAQILQRLRQQKPDDPSRPVLEQKLANAYRDCGESLPADLAFRRQIAILEKTQGEAYPGLAQPLLDLASFYIDQRQPEEAGRLMRRIEKTGISAETSPLEFADYLLIQGLVAVSRSRYPEAERHFLEALAALQRLPGDRSASIANVHAYLALVTSRSGRPQEGFDHANKGLLLLVRPRETSDRAHIRALINLASVHHVIAHPADAERLLRQAITVARESRWVPRPIQAELLQEHARLLRRLDRKQEAREAEALSRALLAGPMEGMVGSHTVNYQDLRHPRGQ